MEKYPLHQSSWGRARQDTISAQKTARFLWGGEGVLAVVGCAWLAQVAPIDAPTWETVTRSVIGGLGGLVTAIVLIFTWNLLRAPYKQRNQARKLLQAKPKPISLPNRGELFRAISEVEQASGVLLMAQEQLDDLQARSPHTISVDASNARNEAHNKYEQAMNKLNAEKLVAGKPFESILSELTGYISTQIWVKEAKPTIIGGKPEPLGFRTSLAIFGRIAGRVGKVIQDIEELSGQARSRGDSQT